MSRKSPVNPNKRTSSRIKDPIRISSSKNNQSQNKKKKTVNLHIEDVLTIFLRWFRLNMGICLIAVIAIFVDVANYSILNIGMHQFKGYCFELNTSYLSKSLYLVIIAALLVVSIIAFVIIPSFRKIKPMIQFTIVILTSIIVLISLVSFTGGILESPFSGAAGIYVSSYFIVQDRKDLFWVNTILLIMVLSLLFLPYFIFPDLLNSYLIHWNNNENINIFRISFIILLVTLAGYGSHKVNKELTQAVQNQNT